jgi:hypothetical protein
MCEGKTHGKSTRLKSPIDNLRIKNHFGGIIACVREKLMGSQPG